MSVALTMLIASANAYAQEDLSDEAVFDRQGARFEPAGVPLGGFRFYPSLNVRYDEDSNVFASRDEIIGDTIQIIRPEFDLQSNWSRNGLRLHLESEQRRFTDNPGEDHRNHEASIVGRWDTAGSGFVQLEYTDLATHEDRTSADDVRGDTRTRINQSLSELSYRIAPGRVFALINFAHRSLDYEDVISDGFIINNDDRDRDRSDTELRIGYDVTDSYSVFFRGRTTSLDYWEVPDDFGFNRNTRGTDYTVGAAFNLPERLSGELFAGRRSQEFDDSEFPRFEGSVFGAEFEWNMTSLTTVNIDGSRQIDATTLLGVSGVRADRLSLRVDHELRRRLMISFEWLRDEEDFQGINRIDTYRSKRFEIRYLVNRHLQLLVSYFEERRNSTSLASFEYLRDVVSLQLVGQI